MGPHEYSGQRVFVHQMVASLPALSWKVRLMNFVLAWPGVSTVHTISCDDATKSFFGTIWIVSTIGRVMVAVVCMSVSAR